MASYVYILRFSNGKLYIGVSVNPKRRVVEHKRTNILVGHAVRKYGEPELLLIYKGDRTQCFTIEQYLVDLFNTLPPNGYNLQRGGMGGSVPGQLAREKMAVARQGRKLSDETKSRMREAHRHRKPISEETRRKLSQAAKNRPDISDMTRERLGRAARGRECSEETRKKLGGASRRCWAMQSTRKRIIEAQKLCWTRRRAESSRAKE